MEFSYYCRRMQRVACVRRDAIRLDCVYGCTTGDVKATLYIQYETAGTCQRTYDERRWTLTFTVFY